MCKNQLVYLLDREKYNRDKEISYKNYRNGYLKKNIKSSVGDVKLNISRDSSLDFEPKAVKKYETIYNELDKKYN